VHLLAQGPAVTRMKRQGCMKPTLGAWWAAHSRRCSRAGSTGSGRKWRMSRRSAMAR
jgi:hypothetical protein